MNTSLPENVETLKAEMLKLEGCWPRALSGKQMGELAEEILRLRLKVDILIKVDIDLWGIWKLLDEAWIKADRISVMRKLVEAHQAAGAKSRDPHIDTQKGVAA